MDADIPIFLHPSQGGRGTLDCKLHGYPKFDKTILFVGSKTLSTFAEFLLQTSSVQTFQPIVFVY